MSAIITTTLALSTKSINNMYSMWTHMICWSGNWTNCVMLICARSRWLSSLYFILTHQAAELPH
jgi:hypothetical protein